MQAREQIERAKKKAHRYDKKYGGCSQSVLGALQEEFGIGNEDSFKAAITSSKEKVRKGFQDAYPSDLSISEVATRVGVAVNTASTYIKVLVAEGFLEQSRPIVNARLFRLRHPSNQSNGNSDEKSKK